MINKYVNNINTIINDIKLLKNKDLKWEDIEIELLNNYPKNEQEDIKELLINIKSFFNLRKDTKLDKIKSILKDWKIEHNYSWKEDFSSKEKNIINNYIYNIKNFQDLDELTSITENLLKDNPEDLNLILNQIFLDTKQSPYSFYLMFDENKQDNIIKSITSLSTRNTNVKEIQNLFYNLFQTNIQTDNKLNTELNLFIEEINRLENNEISELKIWIFLFLDNYNNMSKEEQNQIKNLKDIKDYINNNSIGNKPFDEKNGKFNSKGSNEIDIQFKTNDGKIKLYNTTTDLNAMIDRDISEDFENQVLIYPYFNFINKYDNDIKNNPNPHRLINKTDKLSKNNYFDTLNDMRTKYPEIEYYFHNEYINSKEETIIFNTLETVIYHLIHINVYNDGIINEFNKGRFYNKEYQLTKEIIQFSDKIPLQIKKEIKDLYFSNNEEFIQKSNNYLEKLKDLILLLDNNVDITSLTKKNNPETDKYFDKLSKEKIQQLPFFSEIKKIRGKDNKESLITYKNMINRLFSSVNKKLLISDAIYLLISENIQKNENLELFLDKEIIQLIDIFNNKITKKKFAMNNYISFNLLSEKEAIKIESHQKDEQLNQERKKAEQKRMYEGMIDYIDYYKDNKNKEEINNKLKRKYNEEEIKEIENYFKRYKKLLQISKMVKEELNGKIQSLEEQKLIILKDNYVDKLNDLEKNIISIKKNKIIEENLETKFLIYLLKNYNLTKPEAEKLFNPKDLEEIAKQFIKENNERKSKFKAKQEKAKQSNNQNEEITLE